MVLPTIKVLINYLTTVSMLKDFDLNWPLPVIKLFNFAQSSSSLPITVAFVSCSVSWSFYTKLTFFLLLPFLALAAIVGAYFLMRIRRLSQGRKDINVDIYWVTAFVVLFFSYPSVGRQAVRVLNCSSPIEGTRYITDDYSLPCGTAEHILYSLFAGAVLLIYSLGFPLTCMLLVYRARDELDTVRVRRRFLFLYAGYRRETAWWEGVVMIRKLALSVSTVLLAGNQYGHQLMAGVWILLVALVVQLMTKPFTTTLQTWLEDVCIIAAIASLLLGQLFSNDGLSQAGRDAVAALIIILNALVLLWFFLVFVREAIREASQKPWGKRIAKTEQFQKMRHLTSHGGKRRPSMHLSLELTHITNPMYKGVPMKARGLSTKPLDIVKPV
jgi:hypothetical protein